MVLGNARYRRNAVVLGLAASPGVELLFLPSYSLKLNLVERVWRFIKKEVLAAWGRGDYGMFPRAVDAYLRRLDIRHKKQMDTRIP